MDHYTREDLEEALPTIDSMISRSEKIKIKLKEGSSQASLTRNRLKALYLSLTLIKRELNEDISTDHYTKEDLNEVLRPIISTIKKCEKAQFKLKEGTPQSSLTNKMIKALNIASFLIYRDLNN